MLDFLEDIEDCLGMMLLTLGNHGHQLSEMMRYPFGAPFGFIENLAKRYGADDTDVSGRPKRPGHQMSGPSGTVTEPMPQADYYRRMGVTDPKMLKKLGVT